MEQASSYCRIVVQVDLLDYLLRMGVPKLDRVVDVQRAAEDQTLEGVPADRVHSVDMLRKFTIKSRHGFHFLLSDVDDQTLIVAHAADHLGLEGRKADVQHSFVGGLNAVVLYVVDVRTFGEVHIGEDSFLVCSEDESPVLETA